MNRSEIFKMIQFLESKKDNASKDYQVLLDGLILDLKIELRRLNEDSQLTLYNFLYVASLYNYVKVITYEDSTPVVIYDNKMIGNIIDEVKEKYNRNILSWYNAGEMIIIYIERGDKIGG